MNYISIRVFYFQVSELACSHQTWLLKLLWKNKLLA